MSLPWLPLQTGATALSRLTSGTAGLVFWLGAFGEYSRQGGGAATFSFFYLYFLPVVALGARSMLGNERASDAVVLPDQLWIEGGPHHGVRTHWSSVRAVELEHTTLRLDLGDGVRLDLAHTNDDAERQSLAALRSVLSAQRRRAKRAQRRPEPLPPALVSCPSCGAPARLKDAATVPCEACEAEVPMPLDVRARVAAAASPASRAATSRAVAALFAQPPARRVNALLAALSAWGLGWLPLAATVSGFGPTVLVSIALFLGGMLAMRVVIADRRALSVVCLGFAAKEHGGAPACRACGGPLPTDEGSETVATCVYCDAENVVGTPATEKGGTAAETDRLERALAARDRAVRAAYTSTAMGLGLVVAGLVVALMIRGR